MENELLKACQQFIREHKVRAPEGCYQMDSVIQAAPDLVEQVANIVGYYDDDTDSLVPRAA